MYTLFHFICLLKMLAEIEKKCIENMQEFMMHQVTNSSTMELANSFR